jgi:hypothetical protein
MVRKIKNIDFKSGQQSNHAQRDLMYGVYLSHQRVHKKGEINNLVT